MRIALNRKREAVIFVMVTVLALVAVYYFYDHVFPHAGRNNITEGSLPVVGSHNHLQKLLKQRFTTRSGLFRNLAIRLESGDKEAMGMFAYGSDFDGISGLEEDGDGSAEGVPDHASTNLQVQGVDEADILKTDGRYIYHVNGQRIVVADAYPPAEMKVLDMIDFEEDFRPLELYLDERYLVVMGMAFDDIPAGGGDPEPMPEAEIEIYPPPSRYRSMVTVKVFDIGDKAGIKEVREIGVEGNYVSSRKIDEALYFVVNKDIDVGRIMEDRKGAGQESTPSYRDTAEGSEDLVDIGYDEISYFPEFTTPNYMIVGGINLDRVEEEVKLQTFLGAGENIYASRENLYVAVTGYEFKGWGGTGSHTVTSTTLYKFALEGGSVAYRGKGEVPGRILNQFSMDEHDDYFRLATTTGEGWRADEHTSKNNLYILDETLEIVGKVEGIAPGETIYAARFMGDRGYMVTFRTTDPLYVLDLGNPRHPRILGELKIPGYSDYLHPYDENHLLGFGKEAEEVQPGEIFAQPFALQGGMKVALFDVSDVSRPVEKYNITIGGRGTDSELLRDHKALLFNKERDLLAFPVMVMEDRQGKGTRDDFHETEFVFQGAYVYHFNLEDGFELKGKISHLSDEDFARYEQYRYGGEKDVERIIFIGEALYTVSGSEIRASDLDTLKKINNLLIEQERR
ncbi:MAG: hypothetical protein GX364_04580 [Firmicutes bacterium]|jgi:uncharacterized secreted protein with C-terminal beta-propeller domain|nr:hypothetical protein [Bacillota bacterium]